MTQLNIYNPDNLPYPFPGAQREFVPLQVYRPPEEMDEFEQVVDGGSDEADFSIDSDDNGWIEEDNTPQFADESYQEDTDYF